MDLRGWGVRVVAVGAVGAVVALLAGCGEDTGPVVTPTPTPTETVVESPSPTPSPTPTELTEEEVLAAIPEVARTEDFWGAQEFTRYFLENYHDILRSEPELFRALSGEDCVFCERTSEFFEVAEDLEHSVDGGNVTVTSEVAQGGLQEDGKWGVIFHVDAAPLQERDASGQLVSEDTGGPGVATLLLEFDGHWKVLEVAAEHK